MRDRRLPAALLLTVLVAVAGCVGAPVGGQSATPTPAVDGPDGSAAPANGTDLTALYRETIDSVVMIRVVTDDGVVGGSGFVYDESGHVVTNQHVVGDAETVDVRFRDGAWATGRVVGTDAYSDLAVVEVDDPPDYARPLPVADSTPVPGQRVIALGSPFGLEGTVTSGIVSGVNRSMPTEGGFTIPDTVQTDAAINPGNSGGPLVSTDGEVLGVNRAGQGINVGFAISAAVVERVVPALISRGRFAHAYVGIVTVDVTPTVAEANDLAEAGGILVVRTPEDGPAAGALQPASGETTVGGQSVPTGGDVIVAVEGRPVRTQQDLSRYLSLEANPGDTVTFTVVRDGERRTVDVTLGRRPPT